MIVLPFWGCLSFQTKKILNRSIRNQITRLSSLFRCKDSIPKYLLHLIYKYTQKRVKNPNESPIMDHVLLERRDSTYDGFSILNPKNNGFKLHLKESLFTKRDQPELSKNIYTHPLKLFIQ